VHTSRLLLFLIGFCCSLGAAPPVLSAPASPPSLKKGVFLIATTKLHGTSFEKSVILLTEYGAHGAMGLAINRPTTIPLTDVVPELKDHANSANARIYLGGPVHPMAIIFLARSSTPLDGGVPVFRDIFIGGGLEGLKGALALPQDQGKKVQTYSGYAGWAPNQLENEIARGDWVISIADPEDIFNNDIHTLWQKLSRKWSGQWI